MKYTDKINELRRALRNVNKYSNIANHLDK